MQFCYSNPPFFRGPRTAGSDPGERNFFVSPPLNKGAPTREKVRKQSRERRTQDGRLPQVLSTQQITSKLHPIYYQERSKHMQHSRASVICHGFPSCDRHCFRRHDEMINQTAYKQGPWTKISVREPYIMNGRRGGRMFETPGLNKSTSSDVKHSNFMYVPVTLQEDAHLHIHANMQPSPLQWVTELPLIRLLGGLIRR